MMIGLADTRAWRACAEVLDLVPLKTNGHVVAARYIRAAADEVDRLRAELAISENRAAGYEEVAAELRNVIRTAPHGWECAQETYNGHDDSIDCTCWKADAL